MAILKLKWVLVCLPCCLCCLYSPRQKKRQKQKRILLRFDRTTDEYSVFYHIYRGFNSNNNNKKKNLRRSSGFCVIIRCIIIIGAHIHIELIITAAVAMIIGSLFLFHIISTDFFLFHCNSVINIYVSKKIKKNFMP